MGLVNIVLWVAGVALIAVGYNRARGPWARYQQLKEQDANVARYEAWRGGLRDDGSTGASVAMAVLRRQAQIGAPDRGRRRRAGVPRVPRPVVGLGGHPSRRYRPPIRPHSMAVQRSITTSSPPARAIRAASQLTTPSWSHRTRAPAATASTAWGTHRSDRRKTSTMSTGPVAATAVGEVRVGRQPEHLALVRVHRHAVETEADQRPEHAVRRPRGVGRRADDGDPPGRAQHPLDAGVVEDLDRSATLLEVEERGGPITFLPGQVAASRSYGWPSAAGGMLRPTTPARMMMVTRYGSASNSCGGSETSAWPSWPGGGAMRIAWLMPTDEANSSAAPNAPSGVQRPTIIAARPMNPLPAVIPGWNGGGRLHAQERAAEAGQDAAEHDVPIAQPDDVDADRLGRSRMLADRLGCAGPSGSGTA